MADIVINDGTILEGCAPSSSVVSYCTEQDVYAVLSEYGVEAYVDDNENGVIDPTESCYVDKAIERAANQMNSYLATAYVLAQLVGNAWCRDTNAMLAAYYLTIRRNNQAPDSLVAERTELLEALVAIQAGHRVIPQQPDSFFKGPAISNFQVRLSHSDGPILVDARKSSGPNPPSQLGIHRPTVTGR